MVANVGDQARNAIVVLGCRVSEDGTARGALLRRCRRAALAFHDGLSNTVVVCGGKRWNGHSEAEAMRATLVALGVPTERIHCELQSQSTWGNAQRGGELLLRLGVRKVLVVTCDFHQARALRLFAEAGFEVAGLSCDSGFSARVWAARRVREWFLVWAQPEVSCRT
jgi:uncharacterized SAM-binding protein YcdF (DUF218 family)